MADTRQERLDAALAVLLDGPLPLEQQEGFTTLLPPDVQVTGEVRRARVVIELDGGHRARARWAAPRRRAGGGDGACRWRGVRSVVFTVDGVPTAVPLPGDGSGQDTARVVRLSDYRSVLVR